MGMQLRIEGQPITLGELRELVEHTTAWPAESVVEPRGSATNLASITIEHRTPAEQHDEQVSVVSKAVDDGG